MPNHNTKQIAKNTAYLYVRMILVMAVTLYTSRVVLRTLGFEDFGIYNVVGSVVTFMFFLQAALRNATFRYLTYDLGIGDTDALKRTYSMAINSHVLLAVILFVIMEVVGVLVINNYLNISDERIVAANWAYQFSLLNFSLTIIRSPFESNILAHEKMDFYALTSIVEVILRLLVVYFLLIVTIDKLIIYALLLTLVSFFLTGWYVLYCKWKFEECQYVKCWDLEVLRQFASYSGWSVLVNGACIIRSQSINVFFNIFLGVIANAALGIANQVVGALNAFVMNFTQAFKPQLIKSWAEKDYEYFMRIVYSSSKISYYLLLLVAIPITVNIVFFLRIWLGTYPPMADIYVITIIMYYLVDALQDPLVASVHATGNLKFHQIMISTIVFFVIPVVYILLWMGCSGALVLIINAFSNLLCAIGRTVYMQRLIKLNLLEYVRRVIIPVIIVTLLSIPIPLFLSLKLNSSWLNVTIETLLSFMITAIVCYVLGIDKSEKKMLKTMPVLNKIFKNQ